MTKVSPIISVPTGMTMSSRGLPSELTTLLSRTTISVSELSPTFKTQLENLLQTPYKRSNYLKNNKPAYRKDGFDLSTVQNLVFCLLNGTWIKNIKNKNKILLSYIVI